MEIEFDASQSANVDVDFSQRVNLVIESRNPISKRQRLSCAGVQPGDFDPEAQAIGSVGCFDDTLTMYGF